MLRSFEGRALYDNSRGLIQISLTKCDRYGMINGEVSDLNRQKKFL